MSATAARRRVAVVGNSNSVMRTSYSALLNSKGGVEVINRSIGGCANVLLLDFIATLTESPERFDAIIVETSVIDGELQRLGLYTAERTEACLDLFLSSIGGLTRARVLILLVPTPLLLLSPSDAAVRGQYRAVAERYGVAVLDGYDLLAALSSLGEPLAAEAVALTVATLEAFRLPTDQWASFLWGSLLPSTVPGITTYARHFFADDLHLSPQGHAIVADLLHGWLLRAVPIPGDADVAEPAPPPVALARPKVPKAALTHLTNSLITRDFAAVREGESIRYSVPKGARVVAVMINAAPTSGFLSLRTTAGARCIDLRLAPSSRPFEATLVPLLEPLAAGADGAVTLAVVAAPPARVAAQPYWNLDRTRSDGRVDVAELVLVTGAAAGPQGARAAPQADAAEREVVAQFWAQIRIQEVASFAGITAESVELANVLLNRPMMERVLGSADAEPRRLLARLLLCAGDVSGVTGLLDAALDQEPEAADLLEMRSRLLDLVGLLSR